MRSERGGEGVEMGRGVLRGKGGSEGGGESERGDGLQGAEMGR